MLWEFFIKGVRKMVVILKNEVDPKKVENLTNWLHEQKLVINEVVGEYQTILGLIGDTSRIDIDLIQSLDIVEDVRRISEPYKCANRKFHPASESAFHNDCSAGEM